MDVMTYFKNEAAKVLLIYVNRIKNCILHRLNSQRNGIVIGRKDKNQD